jgi:hypothetical protein
MRYYRSLKPPGLGYIDDRRRWRQKQMLKDRTAARWFGSTRRIEAQGQSHLGSPTSLLPSFPRKSL